MEGNYPPGFYLPEREQQENRQQPSPQQQQQPQSSQQQQHVAHYPFDLPIPYYTPSQHQADYMEDQPTRVFPQMIPVDRDTASGLEQTQSKGNNILEQQTSSHQTSATPQFPSSSTEEPHFLAALNLKNISSVKDLPPSLSMRAPSEDKEDGVIAKETIEKGTEFGPYVGTLLNEDQGFAREITWELCFMGKVFSYIDGQKTWMSHMRFAHSDEEQNMEAYQYCGDIYFRSTKVIDPGSELRVFYSKDYGKCVGIEMALEYLKFHEDSQKFQCSLCEDMFTSPKLTLRHIRCEHDHGSPEEMIPVVTWKKRRKRKYVGIEVTPIQQLGSNLKVNDQEDSTFKCKTCKKTFSSFGRLKAHKLFHEKGEAPPVQFECSECNKVYQSNRSLNRHKKKAHGHLCKYCLESFQNKKDCLKHEQTHQAYKSSDAAETQSIRATNVPPAKSLTPTGIQPSEPAPDKPYDQRPYKCRFCTKRYTSKSVAEYHEKEVHMGEGDFKCTHCTKVFSTISRLNHHLVVHKYINMYPCTECPKSFASESALNNHRGEHTGLKPFKCDVCDRGFRTRKLALSHKRRVHSDRPIRFNCSFCGKGFAEKGDLKVHERRHKGIRQYVCLDCGKGFTSSTSLAAHKQSMHIKIKPFSCAICGKSFALNHRYNHHMAKHRLEGDDQPQVHIQE